MEQRISEEQILQNVALLSQVGVGRSTPKKPQVKQAAPPEWRLRGFDGKSRVLTSFGELPIEALRRNDPVKTLSGKFLKVTWVDAIKLDPEFTNTHPQAQPVCIATGAIGPNKPSREMRVSPAQTVQASAHHGGVSQQKARDLAGHCGVSSKQVAGFTYFTFGCDEPCSVCVDGIWCEVFPKSHELSR